MFTFCSQGVCLSSWMGINTLDCRKKEKNNKMFHPWKLQYWSVLKRLVFCETPRVLSEQDIFAGRDLRKYPPSCTSACPFLRSCPHTLVHPYNIQWDRSNTVTVMILRFQQIFHGFPILFGLTTTADRTPSRCWIQCTLWPPLSKSTHHTHIALDWYDQHVLCVCCALIAFREPHTNQRSHHVTN